MSEQLQAATEHPTNPRALLRFIAPVHQRMRAEKCDIFFSKLNPEQNDSLLDVGGGLGILNEFGRLYKFFREVRVANLEPQRIEAQEFSHVQCEVADGCQLPYENRSFDWVFSNAVIEHVGGWERQKQFALEIQRVARKGYFVATPNRHFPVDPHTLLPCYQFLPVPLQKIACRVSPGYVKRYEQIDLLSAGSLRRLFPKSLVLKCGLPVWPNNLVACSRIS